MSTESIFAVLAEDVANDRTSKYRRVIPESPFDVRLEVAHPSGNRRLVVRTTTRPIPGIDMQTRGFVTTCSATDGLFRVELQDARLKPLFAALVDNFLAALSEASPSADPVSVLLDRMALWQRLFEEQAFDGLSPEAQRGLYAELRFLLDTVLPSLVPAVAVAAWQAPNRTSKDFVHGTVAIEVKSRFKKGPPKVRISSENQLDEAGYRLFLAVITLDPEAQGGESLPELVDRLRQDLMSFGVAMTTFDDQLIRAGYLEIHRSHYESAHYVPSSLLFQIQNGFPRIVSSDLPPGITHTAYDLELVAVTQFLISVGVLQEALRDAHD